MQFVEVKTNMKSLQRLHCGKCAAVDYS